jgi:hypothetical protein
MNSRGGTTVQFWRIFSQRKKHVVKLQTKAMIALVLLITMIGTTSAISTFTLTKTDRHISEFVNGEVQLYSLTQELFKLSLERGETIRNLIMWPLDPIAIDDFKQAVDHTQQTLQQIEPLAQKYGLTQPFEEIKRLQATDIVNKNPDYAWKIISEYETPVERNIKKKLAALEQQELQLFHDKSDNIAQQIRISIYWLYVVITVFILFSAGIYFIFYRHVLQPVQLISQLVKRIAQKKLPKLDMPYHRIIGERVSQRKPQEKLLNSVLPIWTWFVFKQNAI